MSKPIRVPREVQRAANREIYLCLRKLMACEMTGDEVTDEAWRRALLPLLSLAGKRRGVE